MMALKFMTQVAVAGILAAISIGAAAQAYGPSISIDNAKKVAAAAVVAARKINVIETIAITDTAGLLIYFEKMDGTHNASGPIAIGKARSAALFKRPTNAFNDALKAGNTYLLTLEGAVMVPGGFPIVMDGKIVGGIGTSGGSGDQDTAVSQAGAEALK
jgi:glc operon protein GlcG